MDKSKKTLQITVDPVRTPVLYADLIRVTPNENGFVLDVLQIAEGTGQAFVVSRIGMSSEHAKKLAAILAEKIASQGSFLTSKVKISG